MTAQKKTPSLGGGRAHSKQSDANHSSTVRQGVHPEPTGAWAVYAALSAQIAAEDAFKNERTSSDYDSIIPKAASEYTIDTALDEALREQYGSNIELRGQSQWQRFKPPGKKERNGFASVLGVDRAVFGVWGHDKHLVVLSEDEDEVQTEDRCEKARRAREEAKRRQRERRLAQDKKRAQAATKAQDSMRRLPWASPLHPYLVKKRLEPLSLRQEGPNLVAFMTDGYGVIGYQTITPEGDKRFLTGTPTSGAYWPLGHVKDCIIVCEGVGTAIAIHMGYGCAVAAAMSCDNLKPVCLNLRQRHPDVPIIVMADNDHGLNDDRDDNPGVRRGHEAAEAVKGRCIWPSARPGHKSTDFADLWLDSPWYFGREVAV